MQAAAASEEGQNMKNRKANESGVALIVVLLLLLLFTIMMMGFYYVTTGEQKVAASDRDNTVAFYAAQGALENMSSNIAALFATITSPTVTQISALTSTANQPSIPGVTFPTGGYTIANLATPATTNPTSAACTPTSTTLCSFPDFISGSGPLAGLMGIITPFNLTVIADGPNNTEVKMTRKVQEVAVPVFQFGIFSQTDLSFFAGPDFGFGGRTATNGNLYLGEDGNTLTLNDKVTAYQSIIRSQLSNGLAINSTNGYNTSVDITIGAAGGCPTPTCPSCPTTTCRALALTEGSSASNWPTLSMNTYKGYVRSGSTGVKLLNLALALAGATPIAMVQRPPSGESPTSQVGQQRFFNQASVRILLSDTQGQITGLPGVTSSVPYPLAEGASTGMSNVIQRTSSGSPYYLPATDKCHPPVAQSPGWSADNDSMLKSGTTLLGGYIKIEVQTSPGPPATWQDVTQEVLSTGISRDTMTPGVITLVNPPTTSSTASTLSASTYYYYVGTALGPWGETLPSPEVKIKTTSTNKSIKLSWNAVTGATGYRIYRATASGGEISGYSLTVGTSQTGWASPWTSYTDSGTAATGTAPPAPCTEMAILHLEEAKPGVILGTTSYTSAANYVPINMYDPREGEVRDSNSYSTVSLNGVMNLTEVDVDLLQAWLANTLCTASTVPTSCPNGALALTNSGYILYVSDRRGNCNQTASATAGGPCTGNDTGEYGYEDIVNPSSGTGAPNNTLDTGEDVVGDGTLEIYGGIAHPINASNVDSSGSTKYPTGSSTTLTTFMSSLTSPSAPDTAPLTRITSSEAQENPVLFFRRAVRLVDGSLGNLPPLNAATLSPCPNAASPAAFPSLGGFSVAAENPVYILGDYNASNSVGAFSPDPAGKCHVPAAVYADAVTLLSNDWDDTVTFLNPTNRGSRPSTSTDTWYRVAIISGKNMSFPLPTFSSPAAPPKDFGTDGGTHNFLRYIENWGSTLNYLGAMVSFYYAQQGTGIYKCCSTVYNPPTRAYAYDTDFTNITSLPPGTPRFTDVNALSYQQAILTTQ